MDTSNSIFKFVTIRNATSNAKYKPELEVKLKTALTDVLVTVLASDLKQPEKIKSFNKSLSDFIQTGNFYKTQSELVEAASRFLASGPNQTQTPGNNETEIQTFYKNLYDNIVVRSATKSTTNVVFKTLTDTIKSIHQKINSQILTLEDVQKIKIILPEGFVFSFSPTKPEKIPVGDNYEENKILVNKINDLLERKEQLIISKEELSIKIRIEQQKILKQYIEVPATNIAQENENSGQSNEEASEAATQPREISNVRLDELLAGEAALIKAETDVNSQLTILNKEAFQLFPLAQYVYAGERYIDTSRYEPKPPIIEDDAVLVYSNGCYLKFPFQIADLRVVDILTVAYLPNEIAHINNTQSGEKQEKVTRRLKRVETFESLITEDELTKETDTQSTEKFSLEKAASDVQSEETSVNVNASVSGTYGVVTASLDAGFSHSESSENSNSSSQSYAKEVVQRVVDRVSHKVKSERSIKTIEEFEETVTHIIDNTGVGEGPKSYVYRWLTRLVRATLKNYGKRLMFQIDVAHPSNYHLSRTIKEATVLNIPPDPRKLKRESSDPAIKAFYTKHPAFPYSFEVKKITAENYLDWADLYHTKLEQPPIEEVILSYAKAAGDGTNVAGEYIEIPSGYGCVEAKLRFTFRGIGASHLKILIGISGFIFWTSAYEGFYTFTFPLDNEQIKLPISIWQANSGYSLNVEVFCKPTKRAFEAWQIKCYHAIIEAYENLKAEAESKMSAFNPNNPGLNPTRKKEIIRTELKKGALRKMFRCNPFWINDDFEVGTEYVPDCCKNNLNAERVRFLETTFDWKNMTYELHPYFYASHNKDNAALDDWGKLLDLTDDDPHFEAFLQSSYATVRIPVHRDAEKEIAAMNFILNNSIANYSVLPGGLQNILDDLKANTPFGYIDETPTAIPFIEIKKEYDKAGNLKIFYMDSGTEVICTEVIEFDKEGNRTKFYYNSLTNKVVISEIKEGFNREGQKYYYYFNSANEKIITHRTKTEWDIEGNSTPYYSTDLGVFPIPTDLVILEAGGVENGIELRGYPEDTAEPTSEVIIPKQYSPAIVKK